MNNAPMILAIEDAKQVAGQVDGDIVARLQAAMIATKDHWLLTVEDERFRSAVGGVMAFYGEGSSEYERLKRELNNLGKFSAGLGATQAGIEVNWLSLLSELADEAEEYQPLGLLNIWRGVKKGMTTSRKFRRLPLEITAVQVLEQKPVKITSGETMTARPGDWIITSESGARWVCEKDVFPLLYEGVE